MCQKKKYFYFFNTSVQFKIVLFYFYSSLFLVIKILIIFTEYLYFHLSKMSEYIYTADYKTDEDQIVDQMWSVHNTEA